MNEPTEPMADIMPRTNVRFVTETALADAAMASIRAVQDIAIPTMTPSPIISMTVPVAAIVTPMPAA